MGVQMGSKWGVHVLYLYIFYLNPANLFICVLTRFFRFLWVKRMLFFKKLMASPSLCGQNNKTLLPWDSLSIKSTL